MDESSFLEGHSVFHPSTTSTLIHQRLPPVEEPKGIDEGKGREGRGMEAARGIKPGREMGEAGAKGGTAGGRERARQGADGGGGGAT